MLTAGTSDLPVAQEAVVTARALGCDVQLMADVGVAGIHRLLRHREQFCAADGIVVVAGMDGALPSVVGGLVDCPVIAVPTSIGYGAAFGGVAALLTMLNACSANVVVVNIDSGFKKALGGRRGDGGEELLSARKEPVHRLAGDAEFQGDVRKCRLLGAVAVEAAHGGGDDAPARLVIVSRRSALPPSVSHAESRLQRRRPGESRAGTYARTVEVSARDCQPAGRICFLKRADFGANELWRGSGVVPRQMNVREFGGPGVVPRQMT